LPIMGRLFTPLDPVWMRIIAARSPQVLPTLWPLSSWGPIAVHAATLVLAAQLADARLRRLILAALIVAAAGTALAAAAPSVLVVQLQPWRALWLVGVLAAALFPFCAAGLWTRGGATRLALALLALAWIGRESLVVAAPACV